MFGSLQRADSRRPRLMDQFVFAIGPFRWIIRIALLFVCIYLSITFVHLNLMNYITIVRDFGTYVTFVFSYNWYQVLLQSSRYAGLSHPVVRPNCFLIRNRVELLDRAISSSMSAITNLGRISCRRCSLASIITL